MHTHLYIYDETISLCRQHWECNVANIDSDTEWKKSVVVWRDISNFNFVSPPFV